MKERFRLVVFAALSLASTESGAEAGTAGATAQLEAKARTKPATTCFAASPATDSAGVADPFHQVKIEAAEANEKGAGLYKKLQWAEARKLYQQASAADPLFLAPRLNVACSYVRQERFPEAADEVIALLRASFVPWSRELFEAADLGALKDRPDMNRVLAALDLERRRWAEDLAEHAIFFVARSHAPVRLPTTGQGTFILGLKQEAFAYLPTKGLYRQLTATDGRVLAILPLERRPLLAVVTGDKLVRDQQGSALRGVTVELWDLRTLVLSAQWRAPSDLESLALAERPSGLHLAARARRSAPAQPLASQTVRLSPEGQAPSSALSPSETAVLLDGTGARAGGGGRGSGSSRSLPPPCRGSVNQVAGTDDRPPRLVIQTTGNGTRSIESPFGVGLLGLPFSPTTQKLERSHM